ncbi:FliH/SctL family protein [Erythrobacter sp. HA6-11]
MSDLLEQPVSSSPQPSWIEALQGSDGFVDGLFHRASLSTAPSNADSADVMRAQAYAEGEAAGRAAALAEQEQASKLEEKFKLTLAQFDEAAHAALSDQLAQTVLALCEPILSDFALDMESLQTRCETLAAQFKDVTDKLVLHVHPDDAACIEEHTREALTIREDGEMERGSLRLEGPEGSFTDGPADWRRAIAAAVRT